MNRKATLEWIDMVLGSLGRHETMAIIEESIDEIDGDFFKTVDSEVERYEAEGDSATAQRLTEIARTVAALRQNRSENL